MGRTYREEEENLNDILKVNSAEDVRLDKKIIAGLISNDLKIKAANDSQKDLIKSIRHNEITICAGPPGCGKTFVSMGIALGLLRKQENRYKKIYLVKSVTTLKGEELGFLKGDLKEKIEPFMWSFLINMEKMVNSNSIKTLMEKDILRPFPLTYMRGASLDDCIIIADEMQNVTIDNSRTLLTRIGSNCKLILLGDIKQVDMRNKSESSLEKLLKIFNNTEKIGVINMDENDTNVRNPLINTIESKYNQYNEANGKS
jgi:phosphate starvation-inducible PhoH-like protein